MFHHIIIHIAFMHSDRIKVSLVFRASTSNKDWLCWQLIQGGSHSLKHWVPQATRLSHASRCPKHLIDSFKDWASQVLEEVLIYASHLSRLGFWPLVWFKACSSQFLGALSPPNHMIHLCSRHLSKFPEELGLWSLISHLLYNWAKLGFWI